MTEILITGASSGIGKQLAVDYANEGHQVIACGRDKQRLNELTTNNANICSLTFDICDRQATGEALNSLSTIPKQIILNAGDCEYLDDGKIDSGLVKRVFEVNFFAVVQCLELIQNRLESGTHIAVVSSSATMLPLPRAEAYGGSKAALNYFINSLAIDWQDRGISFSLVSPGFVKTPLTDKNSFAMPMLISSKKASCYIRKGLAKHKPHIAFPSLFIAILKSLSTLPYQWRLALMKKMTGVEQ
jgi:short-subunit dehydrogenase